MQGGCIPKPFPIPTFRSTTEKNFHNKLLTDCDRKYVVQTLATVLMTHVQRPSLSDCDIVAKALVHKFSFLNDVEGSGQVRRYQLHAHNNCSKSCRFKVCKLFCNYLLADNTTVQYN